MGQRKTQNIAKRDADVVTLCDVSCMTHINGLLSRQDQRCRAVHIAQVLTNQVDVTSRPVESAEIKAQSTPAPRRWQDDKVQK